MTEQSLYERLGGVDAIAMVVDRFSDKIVENPKLNVNPQLREWNGKGLLPGLKFMRTLWLCAVAVGPFTTREGAARGPQGSPHHL
jgi:hemoglobin